jgi:hypothetical protein
VDPWLTVGNADAAPEDNDETGIGSDAEIQLSFNNCFHDHKHFLEHNSGRLLQKFLISFSKPTIHKT